MKIAFIISGTILFLTACGTIRITTDQIDGSTFLGYETYDFYEIDFIHYDSLPYDEENVRFLLEQIRSQMLAKGFVISENPDLLINIGIVVEREVQTRETDPRIDMNYIGQRNYQWEREDRVVGMYEEGAVSIDFVDAENKQLFWQATAVGMLTNDDEKMKKRITKAIERIFEEMPLY